MTQDLLGVVLAGGASRRMMVDKAWVPVDGEPMLTRVASALSHAIGNVLVVGRTDPALGWPAIEDDARGPGGPLLGVATALRHAGQRGVLAVGVDHPFVRWETLRALTRLAQPGWAIVPTQDGIRQVTCAVYPAGTADLAARELRAAGSLQTFVRRLAVRDVPCEEWLGWGEDGRSWFSVDDPDGLAQAEARFGVSARTAAS